MDGISKVCIRLFERQKTVVKEVVEMKMKMKNSTSETRTISLQVGKWERRSKPRWKERKKRTLRLEANQILGVVSPVVRFCCNRNERRRTLMMLVSDPSERGEDIIGWLTKPVLGLGKAFWNATWFLSL